MKIKEKLMHKYALSPQGASDMLKAFVSVTVSDLVLMIPVSLLYFIVKDYMEGTLQGKGGFYIAGIIVTLALIAITTYIQYNATFLSTYVESGVRRITLAEKLRKIPLSFFGKKDLSDLTSTIMADCAQMETASSHFIPELVGACISTAIVAVGMFFFNCCYRTWNSSFCGKCSDDLKARNCHGCTGWGNSAGKRGDQCAYILYVSAGCIQDL